MRPRVPAPISPLLSRSFEPRFVRRVVHFPQISHVAGLVYGILGVLLREARSGSTRGAGEGCRTPSPLMPRTLLAVTRLDSGKRRVWLLREMRDGALLLAEAGEAGPMARLCDVRTSDDGRVRLVSLLVADPLRLLMTGTDET